MATEFQTSVWTVQRIFKQWKNTQDLKRKEKPGRKRKTNERLERYLTLEVKRDPDLSGVDIKNRASSSFGINLSERSARRILKRHKMEARRPAKKPLLRTRHAKARLQFSRRYCHWTFEDWSNVIFCDESPFEMFPTKGKKLIRRPVGMRYFRRYVRPTIKHGGGLLQVWGKFNFKFFKVLLYMI